MENLDQFMNCVIGISKENYNVTKVLELIGDYDNLLNYTHLYKNEVEVKRNALNLLNQEINSRKGLLDSYRIKSYIAEDLERMGFGINELRGLYDTLMEIGRENNTETKTFEQIKKEFFDDLKSYDEILASRKDKDRLKNEIKNLENQLLKEKERYSSYPKVIESIERLSHAGISENDILTIDKIVSMSGTNHYRLRYKDKRRNKQNLIDDLQKYENLKLAIGNLESKRNKIVLKTHKKIQSRKQKQKKVKNKPSSRNAIIQEKNR
jgi:hypothetical protein